MSQMSAEELQRMKDMLAELNHMLEQRERGEEPDFEGFMQRYGDFFPGNPQSLDELLEQMARSMAQMQQLLNSMTPEQRAQLQEMANALLDELYLRGEVRTRGATARQGGKGARRGGFDRTARRPHGADAEGHPAHRPARARRPVPPL